MFLIKKKYFLLIKKKTKNINMEKEFQLNIPFA
jgi:hypothetical protein